MSILINKIFLKITVFGAILLIIYSCTTTDEFVRPGIEFKRYKRVAVLSFTNYPDYLGSGDQVADIVEMEFLKFGIDVVDRVSLEKILMEQNLGSSGLVDDVTAPEIGKLLGVKGLITGSITEWGTTVTNIQLVQGAAPAYMPTSVAGINLKLIDVETGQIVWSATTRAGVVGNNTEAVAAKKAIDKVVKQFIKHF